MSLINDVLRDMDERHAPAPRTAHDQPPIVAPAAARKKFPPSWLFLLIVGVLIGGLGGLLVHDRLLFRSQPTTAERSPQTQPTRDIPAQAQPAGLADDAAAQRDIAEPQPADLPAATASPSSPDTPARQSPTPTPAPPDDAPAIAGLEVRTTEGGSLPDHAGASNPASNPDSRPDSTHPASRPADPAATLPSPPADHSVASRPAAITPQTVHVQPNTRLNLRVAPSLQSAVIRVVDAGSALTLVASDGRFFQVALPDGATGWISRNYASLTPFPVVQSQPEAKPTTAQQAGPPPTSPVVRVSDTPDALYRQALRALERGDHAQAEVALHRSLAARPAHADALNALAALLLRQQRQAELEALLDSLATPQARLLQARLLAERGEHARAASLLSQLPDNQLGADGFATLGALQQRTGQHQAAVDAFQRALSLGHRHASTFAGLAVSLEATDRPDDARSAWLNTLAAGNADPALAAHARRRLGSTAATGD